jgi:hypothetical protein
MKNSKNKFLKIFLPILTLILGLTGLTLGVINIINNMNDKRSACFDDDSAIIGENHNVLRISSVKNKIDGYYEETTKKFNGIDKIATVDLSENASINVKLEINSGEFKVVLVDTDGNIYVVAETSVDGVIALPLAAGKYDLKLVGRNANFSIKIEFIR